MNQESALNRIMEEMRSKGSLPALNETVLEISRLAKRQDASAPDLAAVIMRDCGLASSLLATVNSAFYAPRLPVKTISAAVTYLGFDKVYMLALGLGLFRHTMATLQKRNLLKLYAISYFSGVLSMALAKCHHHDNPEEMFIAGLLYRLPGMSLANTFPDRFEEMDRRINEDGMTGNAACLEAFAVRYDDICDAVMALYHLPGDVERIIRERKMSNDPLAILVRESAGLSAMIFGERAGGKDALRSSQRRIRKILGHDSFSVTDFIRQTFESDSNVQHFFSLSTDDVEILVNLLQWGKTSPMEVVTHMAFGNTLDATEPDDAPETMIGHFLTEMALCRKRGGQINQLLMLAQEALFRCLPESDIFMAFLSADKQQVQGRFYVGRSLHIHARDFSVPMHKSDSVIVRCMQARTPMTWKTGSQGLGLPYTPFGKLPFKHVYLSPIVVLNQALGLCFAGRFKGDGFSEREAVWVDQLMDHIAKAFSVSRS